MEPVLLSCDGCGVKIRIIRPGVERDRSCPRCGTSLNAQLASDIGTLDPGEMAKDRDESVDESRPRRPVRMAAEAGLLLALFISLLFRLGENPDTRASSLSGVPLAAAELHSEHGACSPPPASTPDHVTTALDQARAETSSLARVFPLQRDDPSGRSLDAIETPNDLTDDEPEPEVPAIEDAGADPGDREPRRIRVRTRDGKTVVARVHGESDGEVHIMLPDGQLGIPDRPAFTDLPFQPATADEMTQDLLEGPFQGFKLHRTPHYLIVYEDKVEFAEESGKVLENLHKGLAEAFRKFDVPIHDAEFPLVAVIFGTEAAFRAHRQVAPEVQAYYEIYSNRIYFYQTSARDEAAPEVAALRRPQTVAHEGTHQILANIGIQPRLAAWPPWLIEGLAEYCSTPLTTRKGTTWSGLGMVNALHLATIRDLDDPLSGQVAGSTQPEHIGRKPGMPMVEYLVRKTDLTPTDYALSWAMTHYLARRRVDEFVAFLKKMSTLPPLQKQSPDDQFDAFRRAFGNDLAKLDREIGGYLLKLKVNNHLPYYAVMFEQRVGGGLVKRAAIVSQSPSMIRQWLETVSSPRDDPPLWQALPFPNRTPALATAEQWVHSR